MANDGFDSTTITFAAVALGKVVSIDFSDEANEVDTTSLDNTSHEFVAGIKSLECNVDVLGSPAVSEGDTGAILITWFHGGTASISSALCTSVSESGSLDDKVTTSYTFKPYGG